MHARGARMHKPRYAPRFQWSDGLIFKHYFVIFVRWIEIGDVSN